MQGKKTRLICEVGDRLREIAGNSSNSLRKSHNHNM